MIRTIVNYLVNILTGWFAGMLTVLGLSFLWVKSFPVMDRTGQGPYLTSVLLLLMSMVSPFSAIGGLVGGLISREGGRKEQLIYAALFGFFASIPVTLFLLWYTGF